MEIISVKDTLYVFFNETNCQTIKIFTIGIKDIPIDKIIQNL